MNTDELIADLRTMAEALKTPIGAVHKTLMEAAGRLEELQAVIAELVEALEVPDSGQYRVYEVLDWSEFIEAKEACK